SGSGNVRMGTSVLTKAIISACVFLILVLAAAFLTRLPAPAVNGGPLTLTLEDIGGITEIVRHDANSSLDLLVMRAKEPPNLLSGRSMLFSIDDYRGTVEVTIAPSQGGAGVMYVFKKGSGGWGIAARGGVMIEF